ncbi:MAG TPA: metalloprotease TldD [Casimicrobiaceae bacterium]|nr:metalloprotease TldD [Casimicrobiaceae bacterium]
MTNLAIPPVKPALLEQATRLLLAPAALEFRQLSDVLAGIHVHHIDHADLYFQYSRVESWSLEEGIVKSGSFSIDRGVGVRAISGEKTAFAYSDDINLEALTQAASATRAIGRQGQSAVAALERIGAARSLYSSSDPVLALGDADKVALLERLEKLARARDPRITQVMASLAGEYEAILVARSDGSIAADVRPLVRVSLNVIAEHNGRREQGMAGGGGRLGYEYFSDALLETYAAQAVDQALVNLDARDAPAGTMTVVLGHGWPGILLHEAIGHGLEGDFNRKGTSAFSGRIGERVGAPGVTVVDDGTLPDRRGSLNVDDEGNPTQRTVLIEDGVLKGYMQDTLNARLMGVASTGNGRRESFAHLPMPRMTNTIMQNGDRDPAEIIASVQNGLYAINFGGGQVDITNGKFVFSAAEAWKIENGRLAYPVKGATLIGNGPDALTRVTMIGNDMALDSGIGTCGKEGQSVPVGVGQPTLRIDGLTVGGTG